MSTRQKFGLSIVFGVFFYATATGKGWISVALFVLYIVGMAFLLDEKESK